MTSIPESKWRNRTAIARRFRSLELVFCAMVSCSGAPRPGASAPPNRASAFDLPGALPPVVDRADASGRVLSLREPLDRSEVTALVRSFIDAWRHASLKELTALLSPDAVAIEGDGHAPTSLVESFRQRLQAHEYARLGAVEVIRSERIRAWTWEDMAASTGRPRPDSMRPDELYIEAPLEVSRSADEKLFGERLIFVLRTSGAGLRIAAYGETEAPR